jgi:FkbM family methyltransferase
MVDYSGWENVLSNDIENLINNYFDDIKSGEVVYDVGANVGVFSEKILLKYPDTKLVLFEPIKEYYQYLKTKFAANPNITVHNFALIEDARFLSISRDGFNLGYNTLTEIAKYGHAEDINGISLSSLQRIENIPLPDLIKVDVENSEYLFIEGCKELFKNHVPRKIVMEIGVLSGHALWEKEQQMIEYLFSLGYSKFEYKEKTSTYEAVFVK